MNFNLLELQIKMGLLIFQLLYFSLWFAGGDLLFTRASYSYQIVYDYPKQLIDPQKKTRRSFDQFGYNLLFLFSLLPDLLIRGVSVSIPMANRAFGK
jgi:hypothetical protein